MKPAKVIVNQSNQTSSQSLEILLKCREYDVQFMETSAEILGSIKNGNPPDLLILDQANQGFDALGICRSIKFDPDSCMIPVLLLSTSDRMNEQESVIEAGCDDLLVQPVSPSVLLARVRSLLRQKSLTDELDDAESVLFTLARTIEAKDPYTLGHADRVAQFAIELGKKLGVNGHDLDVLRKGGMLHDVGKIAIPDAILLKPGRYSPEEFEVMKKHPVLGCEICQKLRSVKEALPLIRYHHEKLDGSGYPDGLKQEQIPPLVRIVTIVDIYDALRSKRSYKEAFPVEESFKIMWEEVGKGWWDADILSIWEKIILSQKAFVI